MKEFKIQTLAMKKQILMAVDKTDTLCFTQKQHICNALFFRRQQNSFFFQFQIDTSALFFCLMLH